MTPRTWKEAASTGIVALLIILAGLGLLIFGLFWLYLLFKSIFEEGVRDSYNTTYNLLFGLFLIAIGAYMIYVPFDEAVKKRLGKRKAPPPTPPPPPTP